MQMGNFKAISVAVLLLCAMVCECAAKVRSVVIPVQFSDVKFTQDDIHTAVYNLFNGINYSRGGATGSVSEYFDDNLWQRGYFDFTIISAETLPQTKAFYGADSESSADANIEALIFDACTAAAASGTDFSLYDSDSDGFVDHVYLFFAGYNQSESGNPNDILPQTWDVSDKSFSFGTVKIGKFSCCSELKGGEGAIFTPVGTICHELCHLLGLQDMYDVNGPIEGLSEGLYGSLSIMDKGNYNNDGRTPPYFNSIELDAIGMLRKIPVIKGLTYELYPLSESRQALMIETNVPGEYFLIEYRIGEKWDAFIGGRGALVYHVDKSKSSAGSLIAEMRWQYNAVNACAAHPCATPFNAYGATDASGMFYPGNRDMASLNSYESEPLLLWSGDGTGISLLISYNAYGNINVTVDSDNGWNIPYANDCSMVVNQTDATISWKPSRDMSPDDTWTISWGPSGSIMKETIKTKECSYTFSSLMPGLEYDCVIFAKKGDYDGKRVMRVFTTIPQLSQFPLIAEMDRRYSAGDEFRLHLLNYNGSGDVVWYINGEKYEGERYTFASGGKYTIKVEILPDNEILEKTIVVSE